MSDLHPNPHTDTPPVVLLIDDSQFVHRLLDARLRSESIVLLSAEDGKRGLEVARGEQPSLILLDLDMPVMDGFETLRELKEDPCTKDIPVIVLSGMNSSQDKVAAFDLGAIDFVTKPFELTELRARVRSSLKMSLLLRMLAQKAHIDGLSGLYNRPYFDEKLRAEYDRTVRHGQALSIAMIDIDHFKSVNDTYGHPAGDTVISGVANLIMRETRSFDISCRYGGEEFALIMPETEPQQALQVCERVRMGCEKLAWSRHPARSVTLSVGIVGVLDGDTVSMTPEGWVEAADKNLYKAKQQGRNMVVATGIDGQPIQLAKAG
ncbi:MAG: diguanylate cyclase [Phycisphaerales bacterium]|jgi:diguanylate cyclase (GGDEF)-like protein|nr:diguanylate cyclase [Phycisphaerales bacterium]